MSPSRRVAFETLRLVEQGRFASDVLREHTRTLKTRDAALAHEIVFGVLRFQAQLDAVAAEFSGRDTAKLDREVRLALRIGIYQLRYLDRVPRHAAVTESVEMVKRAHKRSAAGLVNAVLRSIAPRGIAGERLRWNLIGLEREIRALASERNPGLLSEAWSQAAGDLLSSSSI